MANRNEREDIIQTTIIALIPRVGEAHRASINPTNLTVKFYSQFLPLIIFLPVAQQKTVRKAGSLIGATDLFCEHPLRSTVTIAS